MLNALENRDGKTIAENLMTYRELLTEHIRKEDEIMFPWMDKQLSNQQVGKLFANFEAVDRQIDVSPEKYAEFINRLEIEFEKLEDR